MVTWYSSCGRVICNLSTPFFSKKSCIMLALCHDLKAADYAQNYALKPTTMTTIYVFLLMLLLYSRSSHPLYQNNILPICPYNWGNVLHCTLDTLIHDFSYISLFSFRLFYTMHIGLHMISLIVSFFFQVPSKCFPPPPFLIHFVFHSWLPGFPPFPSVFVLVNVSKTCSMTNCHAVGEHQCLRKSNSRE